MCPFNVNHELLSRDLDQTIKGQSRIMKKVHCWVKLLCSTEYQARQLGQCIENGRRENVIVVPTLFVLPCATMEDEFTHANNVFQAIPHISREVDDTLYEKVFSFLDGVISKSTLEQLESLNALDVLNQVRL